MSLSFLAHVDLPCVHQAYQGFSGSYDDMSPLVPFRPELFQERSSMLERDGGCYFECQIYDPGWRLCDPKQPNDRSRQVVVDNSVRFSLYAVLAWAKPVESVTLLTYRGNMLYNSQTRLATLNTNEGIPYVLGSGGFGYFGTGSNVSGGKSLEPSDIPYSFYLEICPLGLDPENPRGAPPCSRHSVLGTLLYEDVEGL